MIDWTTVILPFEHDQIIRGGLITSVDENGEIEWETAKGRRIQGSHDSSVGVKTCNATDGKGTHLWISGNPAKFLQGHNVTGSDDLCLLVADMAEVILTSLGFEVSQQQHGQWREGDFVLKLVDINYMRHCGSRTMARAMLKLAQHTGCMRHSGRGAFTGDTLYFSKHSRRRAIKMYVKGDELERGGKKHRLPLSLGDAKLTELQKIADDALRIELRLLALELKALRLQDGKQWRNLEVKGLFNLYVERIEWSANVALSQSSLLSLPKHLQRTYALWKEGIDLRAVLKPATYYRQRRELRGFQIDIGAQQF